MKIATLAQIKEILPSLGLIPAIEAGFAAYSSGRATVPPVGELILDKGEVHIKSGYIQGRGFLRHQDRLRLLRQSRPGPAVGQRLHAALQAETGEFAAILLDEGHLTDVRTAVAGAVAAKYLRPAQGRTHRHRRRRRPGPAPARMADARHGLPGRPGLGAPGGRARELQTGDGDPRLFGRDHDGRGSRSSGPAIWSSRRRRRKSPSSRPPTCGRGPISPPSARTRRTSRSSIRRSWSGPTWSWPTASPNAGSAARSTKPSKRAGSGRTAASSSGPSSPAGRKAGRRKARSPSSTSPAWPFRTSRSRPRSIARSSERGTRTRKAGRADREVYSFQTSQGPNPGEDESAARKPASG